MASTATETRLHFADLLKSVSIFMVVFYHCFTAPIWAASESFACFGNYLVKSLLCISIPLFFLVNGGLLFNRPFTLKKHVLKMLRIIFLVIVWDILNVSVKALLSYHSLSVSEFFKKLWLFEAGWSNHLWFLMSLFILYAFFPLMKSAYDYQKKNLLFFGVITAFVVLGNSTINLLISLGTSLPGQFLPESPVNIFNQFNPLQGFYDFTFLYFILGAFLFAYVPLLQKSLRKHICVIGLASSVFLLAVFGFTLSKKSASAWDPVWGGFPTIFALVTVVCVCGLSLSYKFCETKLSCRLIRLISDCSLGIYLLQSLFTDLLRPYYVKLPISQSLLGDLIFTVILFSLCTLLTLILKKIPYLKILIQI